jgi:hypothetical protein
MQRSAPQPRGQSRAQRGGCRKSSQQSPLGARAPGQRDEAWFKREILPKLDAFALAELANATGLSLAACSRFRAGARIPHPSHWAALLALIEG